MTTQVALSDHDVEQYRSDGILFPLPVLEENEVRHYRSELKEVLDAMGPGTNPHDIRQPHLHFRWMYELSHTPRLLDVVERLIGPDIMVCRSTIFFKDPGSAYYTDHQDAYGLGFQPEHADHFVTAWIALTESNLDNGCMHIVPGSHKTELPHTEPLFSADFDAKSAVSRGLQVDMPAASKRVPVCLKPGEMSVHHAHLVHGSGPNQTATVRTGCVVRFQAPFVAQGRPLHHPVYMVRGRDTHGLYKHVENLPPIDKAEGIARCRAYIAEHPEGATHMRQSALLRNDEAGNGETSTHIQTT